MPLHRSPSPMTPLPGSGPALEPLATPSVDEVHLWCGSLERSPREVALLALTLSVDERSRAARLSAPRDRRRFVVARGLLRVLLGRYLGRPPAMPRFAYGPFGKPELEGQRSPGRLSFNLAHSGELALYAFGRGRRVGVDVEAVRPLEDMAEVSRLVFSRREREQLWTSPPVLRQRAFFDGWVRKEAVLKALGDGLGANLQSLEVSHPASGDRLLWRSDVDVGDGTTWTLSQVEIGPSWAAAVAVEGNANSIEPFLRLMPKSYAPEQLAARLEAGHWFKSSTADQEE